MKKQTILIIMLGMMTMILSACNSSAARYNNQGNNDFEKAAYDDALEEYTAAKETDAELAEPYYNSGNAFHNKGDLKSAVGQTQQALRLADDKLAQRAFYNLGNAYFLTEDWPAAIKAYQESLLLDPNDQEAKHNLELALRKVQRQSQQSGDGQPQPNQPGDNQGEGEGQPQDQEGDQPEPGGEEEGEEGPGGEEEEEEEGGGPGGDEEELSPEEAEQLLDNLSQNSQTLQERLNQSFDGQGSRKLPAQDW
ncbi:tetratricopeptide repeat protein [Anaerolineales bacterium HSG6]|nr:tetratricopeptide repeat protein [Anaerolineales bacterium HSG6]